MIFHPVATIRDAINRGRSQKSNRPATPLAASRPIPFHVIAGPGSRLVADARQGNQAVEPDAYTVQICDIDQAGPDGKPRWQVLRDWLAAASDDLQAPPLAKPRPEDAPEAKAALRSVRQLHPDDAWAGRV